MTYFNDEAKAQAIADANNEADADWTYVVQVTTCGLFFVKVYDEDGNALGIL